MNRQETAKIITYLREFYPQGKEITEATVNAWHTIFQDYDYELVWEVTREVVKEYEGYSFPPPSAIIQKLKAVNEPLAIEYWNMALKAIKKGQSFTQEDFEKLPTAVQTYFSDVSQIRDLGLMEIDNIPYEKAKFLRQIEIIAEREHTSELLLANANVKELAEKLT